MSPGDRVHERIRWRCRRGMLELDLVLNAFAETHLQTLAPAELETFRALLERPDPELLDYVMGRDEPSAARELELVALMRGASTCT
jgi:succinate dehydrogenase flavin-adding protein (antitoxin of CptAB toxin-antitoxin module)